MPTNATITRNRPIATLIKWYTQRTKGKVVESRQEIQRRFDGLDWKDQKKIILAFLSSGKADRQWVYSKLIKNWDDDFQPIVQHLFEEYHEEGILLPVTLYFPTDYIKEHTNELSGGRNYYKLCYRLANDKVDFEPKRELLSPKGYLYILKLQGKKPDDDVVLNLLYDVLYDISNNPRTRYDDVIYYPLSDDRHPLIAMEFRYIYDLVERLKELGCDSAINKFLDWDILLGSTIANSKDFQELDKNDYYSYRPKRKLITKKYIQLLLNRPSVKEMDTGKHAISSETNVLSSVIRATYKERFEKMKEENESLKLLEDRFGLEISE